MSDQPKNAQSVPGSAADPPKERPAWLDALRAEIRSLRDEIRSLRGERDPDRLLTREETADRLRISVRTLSTITAAGELRAVRIKGRVLYHPEAVEAYVRRQAAEGAA